MSSVRGSLAIAVLASLTVVAKGGATHSAIAAIVGAAYDVTDVVPTTLRMPGWLSPLPNIVEGSVTTIDGRPVAGATIRIARASSPAGSSSVDATTDAAGRYRVAVPPGEYTVDAFVDLEYGGQTYKQLWLDRGNSTCERVRSDQGIVRNFVLRLSGLKRCIGDADPGDPASYNGAYISAPSSAFPADAVVTFSLTPLGSLADGTTGATLRFERNGAALRADRGPVDQTSVLYDIPLGRYRATAEVRYVDGTRHSIALQVREGGGSAGNSVDIAFSPNPSDGGIRPVGLALSTESTVSASAPSMPTVTPTSPPAPPSAPKTAPELASQSAELPIGRYACSIYSQYAGEMPSQRAIYILAGGHYQGFGGAGGYVFDPSKESVRWTSGPLANGDLRVSYGQRSGRPTITVVGGGPVDDPLQRNYCVLMGR